MRPRRRTSHAGARRKVTCYHHARTLIRAATGLGAPAVGMGEALGAIAEKICLADCECEQSLFRRRMRFDRAVGPDMAKRQSARGQRPADQQAAMAVERLALGAKQ